MIIIRSSNFFDEKSSPLICMPFRSETDLLVVLPVRGREIGYCNCCAVVLLCCYC